MEEADVAEVLRARAALVNELGHLGSAGTASTPAELVEEIERLREVATAARLVVDSESIGQPSVDVRAMRKLRQLLDALSSAHPEASLTRGLE